MANTNVIGIDLAKNVFQVCGLSKSNKLLFNRQLSRTELASFMAKQAVTNVAMEACYSSHYWGREIANMGHRVKLLPAQHVKPFVRGNKSDANDALAIAEAANRPDIKAVPIKTLAQQDIQCLHRLRERHVAQRTALINQTRGLLSEYGIVAAQGHKAFCKLLRFIASPECNALSPTLKKHMNDIADEYYWHTDKIVGLLADLTAIAKQNPLCQFLLSIPGIGVINATAIYSAIGDGSQFASAREFAVWLGLTPKQAGSGEKTYSGGITKRGNRYLRKQLVHGARAAVSRSKLKTDHWSLWANALIARRGMQKGSVAMAARMSRTAWILLQRREMFKPAL